MLVWLLLGQPFVLRQWLHKLGRGRREQVLAEVMGLLQSGVIQPYSGAACRHVLPRACMQTGSACAWHDGAGLLQGRCFPWRMSGWLLRSPCGRGAAGNCSWQGDAPGYTLYISYIFEASGCFGAASLAIMAEPTCEQRCLDSSASLKPGLMSPISLCVHAPPLLLCNAPSSCNCNGSLQAVSQVQALHRCNFYDILGEHDVQDAECV